MNQKYSKSEALRWYVDYKNNSVSVSSISKKYGVKSSTMVDWFKRLNLPIRASGFRPGNLLGLNDRDLVRARYVWFMKHAYKRRAKRKGLQFDLTEDQFIQIVTSNCIYCNKSYRSETRTIHKVKLPMLSVDRWDSSLGYTADNCVPCCKVCNTSKMDTPAKVWIDNMIKILGNCESWTKRL